MEKKQEITQRFILVSRILLAILFLLSAVAKLYPSPHFALTTFEMKQLIPMGFSETSAAYFSRILIGCELALGILLLQRHYFKRLVLPMSFLNFKTTLPPNSKRAFFPSLIIFPLLSYTAFSTPKAPASARY